jgi:hypothetical protein
MSDGASSLPCSPHDEKEEMTMAKKAEKLEEKPPVHVTASGSLFVKVEDIFNSRAGRDIIRRMTKIPASWETSRASLSSTRKRGEKD